MKRLATCLLVSAAAHRFAIQRDDAEFPTLTDLLHPQDEHSFKLFPVNPLEGSFKGVMGWRTVWQFNELPEPIQMTCGKVSNPFPTPCVGNGRYDGDEQDILKLMQHFPSLPLVGDTPQVSMQAHQGWSSHGNHLAFFVLPVDST